MPHTQTGWKSPAAANPDAGRVAWHAGTLVGIETRPGLCPGSMRASTVAWSETNWAADGTLFGGVGQAGFADDLPGTSNSIAACGHQPGVTGLFDIKFGAFEARERCWRRRWRRADAQTERQTSLRPFLHAMQDARRSDARAPCRQSGVLR